MDSNIAPEVQRIKNAKEQVRQSIISKGISVPEGTLIDSFPSYIDQIQTGPSDYPNAEDNTF